MAKKKEKRRSLLDKIRGLETETHPQGKLVGQLFQAIAGGEIEVCCVLFKVLSVVCSGLKGIVWKPYFCCRVLVWHPVRRISNSDSFVKCLIMVVYENFFLAQSESVVQGTPLNVFYRQPILNFL